MSSRLNVTGGTNSASNWRTTTGFAVPAGDWTMGIWQQPYGANSAGSIVSRGALAAAAGINLYFSGKGYRAGGQDDAGNLLFSGGTLDTIGGAVPTAYPAHPDAAFSPSLVIIRRRAGFSEFIFTEAGQAPTLVASQSRTFTGLAVGNWSVGGAGGTGTYEGDVEGFFFADAAVSDADIALMAAGAKPSSVSSLSANLQVYYPLDTSVLADTANPAAAVTNLGSLGTVVFRRYGAVANYGDGPALRGATANNMAGGTATEPTNVVALTGFKWWQVVRHLGGSATLPFTGFDYGTGTADIQVRFVDPDNATATAWTTLVAGSVGGGAAINTTLAVPKGYWKNIEVQRVNSAGGTGDSSRPNRSWTKWAVGEVIAAWSDSHIALLERPSLYGTVAPNGYTSKLGTSTSGAGIIISSWNHYRGTTGDISGSNGENQLANNLSVASQCCVGFQLYWVGATLLANWNGRISSASFTAARVYSDGNGGLNRPNVIAWIMNRQNAQDIATADQAYSDMDLFKAALDANLGAGTYTFAMMESFPCLAPDTTGGATLARSNLHVIRGLGKKWCDDNAAMSFYIGSGFGFATNGGDGVHPDDAAFINIIGPIWGNAMLWMRGHPSAVPPLGPYVEKFWRSGSDLYVKVAGLNGASLLLKNGAVPSGFSLSADNFTSTIAVTTAALFSANTVKITPASMPADLRLRLLFGAPGVTGSTTTSPANTAAAGTDNILYTDQTILGYQPQSVLPIFGDAASFYSMSEGVADGAGGHFTPLLLLMCR